MVLIDGVVTPDLKAHGRGAWVHRKCLKRAIERNAFRSAFKLTEAPDIAEVQRYLEEMDAKDMKLK